MNNKKVAILMSTYNGEKYIKEQIESLIHQTYNNFYIYIRDDGSKDNTISRIKEIQRNHDNIVLIEAENVGFIKSFFELLNLCSDADYYAYCDQDDVWMEDKIERAVSFLNRTDSNKPALHFSNSDYYDENMNYLATAKKEKVYNFRHSLVECVTQGMTMVINNKTRELIIKDTPKTCLFHDWWTYMVCSGIGQIVYDDKSLVKYRRHNKSVTVEGRTQIDLLIFRIKSFIIGDSLKKIKEQIIEYDRFYYNQLSEENKKLIKLFTNKKYSLKNALKKVLYPERFRRKFLDEINIRFLFLIGLL